MYWNSILKHGGIRNNKGKYYRIFKNHEREEIEESIKVDHKNKEIKLTFKMDFPKSIGVINIMKQKYHEERVMKETIDKITNMIDNSPSSHRY